MRREECKVQRTKHTSTQAHMHMHMHMHACTCLREEAVDETLESF